MYFLLFGSFEQLCASLEKQSCPGIFQCIKYTFYIQEFWATCACPVKQRVPWIHSTEYIFFIIQNFWATSACPENRVCPEIFQIRGGGRPPDPPPRTPMRLRRVV